MNGFNEEALQAYYDSRNYEGAIKYLQSYKPKDYQSQLQVNHLINNLRMRAGRQASMINGADKDEVEAFNFMQGIEGDGRIPKNVDLVYNKGTDKEYRDEQRNSYGQTYLDNINSLKSNDGKDITKIAIDVNGDDNLSRFTSELGIDNINNNNLGIVYQALDNNKHRLVIDRDNKNLYKLLNIADKVSNKSAMDVLESIGSYTTAGAITGTASGSFFAGIGAIPGFLIGTGTGLLTGTVKEIYDKIINSNRLDIKGISEDNHVYSADDFNSDNLKKALNTVNKANDVYKNLMNKKSKEQTYVSKTVSTPFLGTGHAEAYKARQQGKISKEEFAEVERIWKDYYINLTRNADFGKKKVFAWSEDSGEGKLLKKVDNTDVQHLQGEVLQALEEGNASMSLTIKDGVLGTKFVISPKNKGEDESKARAHVYKEVFVEGLFGETADAVFERDTKTFAARQNADMKKYQYEQPLSNGITVGYEQGVGRPYKKVPINGRIDIEYISEAELLSYLNESNIINQSVEQILANMAPDGNLYITDNKGIKTQVNIDQMINMMATQGTNELIPVGTVDNISRMAFQNKLYRKMRNQLNGYLKNYNNR